MTFKNGEMVTIGDLTWCHMNGTGEVCCRPDWRMSCPDKPYLDIAVTASCWPDDRGYWLKTSYKSIPDAVESKGLEQRIASHDDREHGKRLALMDMVEKLTGHTVREMASW